jgi:hypothetical protein
VRDKPDSIYHSALYNKPQRTVQVYRAPSPVYSKESTPEKHYLERKEYSPVDIPTTNYPEADTVHIDLNKEESYELHQ